MLLVVSAVWLCTQVARKFAIYARVYMYFPSPLAALLLLLATAAPPLSHCQCVNAAW